MDKCYLTSFCNFPHRLSDGKPVGHNCYILPVAALQAEREDRIDEAIEILRRWRNRKEHRGVR